MPIVLVDNEELVVSTGIKLFLRRLARAGYAWQTEKISKMIVTHSIQADYGCCPIVALAHKRTGLPVKLPKADDYKHGERSSHWHEFLYNGGASCGYYDEFADISKEDRMAIIQASDFYYDNNTRLLRKYMLNVLNVVTRKESI